jgi:hypothetical protein
MPNNAGVSKRNVLIPAILVQPDVIQTRRGLLSAMGWMKINARFISMIRPAPKEQYVSMMVMMLNVKRIVMTNVH